MVFHLEESSPGALPKIAILSIEIDSLFNICYKHSMTLVIGLTGEKGSGKQTFADFLKEVAKDKDVKQVRFSDLLAETLNLWSIPTTRANLQKMAIVMNEGFGPGTLSKAIQNRISKTMADIILLDGVRWESDMELIRSFPKNLLVYITADVKTRYERLKNRSEKVDEQGVNFEQFMEEEQAKTEVLIPKIGQGADIKIQNNGSLPDLKAEVEQIYNTKLQQL